MRKPHHLRLTSVMVGAAVACAGILSLDQAYGQASSPPPLTHVICVTNDTDEAHTLWLKEVPEAPGPDTAFGAIPRSLYCYRRGATPGRLSTIAITGQTDAVEIRTAEDIAALATQMNAMSQTPPACEISADLLEQADVERRLAVLVRLYAESDAIRCETSVGAAPTGAGGLRAFETTRDGRAPTYFESADRQSFALCVASDRRVEAAVWPQARPELPSDFVPQADVVRTSGGVPWCYRMWLRPGGDVAVSLGAIDAREEINSPDFAEGCTISADLIAQARAGARAGVLVSVSRRRGQRQCEASIMSAPERAIGLNAFNPPPVRTSEPS